jgi:hypothetical protein
MLPLSSESISQIKVLQHTNAAYLFNVQRIATQKGDFCDQCVHELFCYFWAGEFTPKRAPTFSETPGILLCADCVRTVLYKTHVSNVRNCFSIQY